jgi:flagellar motor switch protein FliM
VEEADAREEQEAPVHEERVHEARAHDFARTEALRTATVQALEGAYASFARGAAEELSSHLRSPVEFALVSLDQLSYEEYVRAAPDPTVAGVFGLKPLPGRGILELSPAIGLWIVDRVLGGSKTKLGEPRPLTEMEKALVEGTLSRLLEDLATAWQELGGLEPELLEIVDSADAGEIGKRTDAVAAAWFEVKAGEMTERASICLPAISLKVGRVGSGGEEGERGEPEAASVRRRLTRVLGSVPVTCVVRLGRAAIPARELAALQRGDVVCLDTGADESLEMVVGDARRFRCRPVADEDRVAVEIQGEEQ